jgi:hypothetical protein
MTLSSLSLLAVIDVFALIGYAFVSGFFMAMILAGWRAWRNWRRGQFARSVGAAIVFLTMFAGAAWIGIIPGFGFIRDWQFTSNLFGRSITLTDPELAYDSERAFNGDGYSISVHALNEEFAKWVEASESDLIAHYPVKPSVRDHWAQVTWKRTPITSDDQKYLDFACSEYASGDASQLAKAKQLTLKLAHEPGHLYAFCHQTHSYGIGDIDFYILSPKTKKLVMINHNT